MPLTPSRERLFASGPPIGVDRKNNIIRGYVLAQRGHFKSEGRGQFDDESLAKIVQLMQQKEPKGLKSRFTHPGLSSDGLGSFLGRVHNPRVDNDRVRGDLHLDRTAFDTPNGNLGKYVLDLAESDPDALSSSLVLSTEKIYILDEKGKQKTDDKGDPLPPIWRPTKLHFSDIVDTGDAVDGLLSAGVDVDGLPMAALWRGSELLDSVFAGQPAEVIRARCNAWLERYLSGRAGTPALSSEGLRRRVRLAELEGKG